MDDDDASLSSATPAASEEYDHLEDAKQFKSLDTYLKSLPYECESPDEMQEKLRLIVSRIVICAKTKNWATMIGWDSSLQYWMIMRYPMSRPIRASLAKLYYELLVTPGAEPRLIRGWADTLARLIPNRAGSRRKLEISDLQLSWKSLWRVMESEVWIKTGNHDSTRTVSTTLLTVAELASRYFPGSEIPVILDTILSKFEVANTATVITLLTAFLPLTDADLYLPILFKLWEALNSSQLDERLLDIFATLSQEHVAGASAGIDGAMPWKDVGIFTNEQWSRISRACLVAMNVPVGAGGTSTSSTGSHADLGQTSRLVKKGPSVLITLATLFVYSMSVDGPHLNSADNDHMGETAFLAGSKALHSLNTIITSTETYFHPSNYGAWTVNLTTFMQRLTYEFSKRWNEEHQPECKTPIAQRLSLGVKRAFVETLKTPALLAMFSKDPVSTTLAQATLKTLSVLEPNIIMPAILERAYNGLESINETHRTTAVLSCLSGVASTLVSENIFLGGQKHLMPLLELALPGLDINDPLKTVCTSILIVVAVSSIKIGDLTQTVPLDLGSDAPGEDIMVDTDPTSYSGTPLIDGAEPLGQRLNLREERTLVRESTASFPDWVTSFFRRVFALFENLPEEGGKSNRTGGKSEETILKSLRSALDTVSAHLSNSLFDLVLRITYDYAISTARANSVKAFGDLVASLAKANPKKTIAKFLPYCSDQIRIELEHGASSTRTTTTNLPVPSDTTFHWHLTIIRGILANGGKDLLAHKDDILNLMHTLVVSTKNERGYSSTGRLVGRVLAALTWVYALDQRFVNSDEWESETFNRTHNQHWGRLYRPEDVKIEWHIPSDDEISFALEIMDTIVKPSLDLLEAALQVTPKGRDAVWRNDFCRYLYVVRSAWAGLPTIFLAQEQPMDDPYLDTSTEVAALTATSLGMKSGFVLTDPQDTRYQRILAHREQFGKFLHRASLSLRHSEDGDTGDEHIDAILAITRAIDTYLLDYGMTRPTYASQKKHFDTTRDLALMTVKQKEFPRHVWIKRAQVYHASRVHTHSLYRRRTAIDDELIGDLVEFSFSPYTRVRKNSQAYLITAISYLVRSARQVLVHTYEALAAGLKLGKAADPDRQKGALYVLWSRSLTAYALNTPVYVEPYFSTLLGFQHQEKPSIQQLVSAAIEDAFAHVTPEAMDASMSSSAVGQGLESAIAQVEQASGPCDPELLSEAESKLKARVQQKNDAYDKTRASVLAIMQNPTIHWKYKQWAMALLVRLLRKDAPTTAEIAQTIVENVVSDHPTTRQYAQSGLVQLLRSVKARTFSESAEDLWLNAGKNPLRAELYAPDFASYLTASLQPLTSDTILIDAVRDDALIWKPVLAGYRLPPQNESAFAWEPSSRKVLAAISTSVDANWFSRLASLWSQEGNRSSTSTDLRMENLWLIKILFKIFEDTHLDSVLTVLEPVLHHSDKFQQRAAAEILGGLIRASKHFPRRISNKLWEWVSPRLPDIFAQMTPDTITFWDSFFNVTISGCDPRRVEPLINYVVSLPIDFNGDSVFALSKSLSTLGTLADCLGARFLPKAGPFIELFFGNLDTPYEEIRVHIIGNLASIMSAQWRPAYSSAKALLEDCGPDQDPLRVRDSTHMNRILNLVERFPKWKAERLPGARVSHSTYDKVGLTVLSWIWTLAYTPRAPSIFVYVKPLLPEILRMSELQDSSEIQTYSSGVLYILSAITPPPEYVEPFTETFIEAVKSSPSWRIRHKAIPVLSVWYFRNLPNLSQSVVSRILAVLVECLKDENVEVREVAASTLSGVLRCSEKQNVIALKDRFARTAQRTKLPPRGDSNYADALRTLHSAVLGMIAALQAYPYVVEPWMPSLIERLSRHSSDPQPVSTAIRQFAATFKKTHQDTWHVDQHMFDEEQSQALATIVSGTSYYA